jgi:hypothetical protein
MVTTANPEPICPHCHKSVTEVCWLEKVHEGNHGPVTMYVFFCPLCKKILNCQVVRA